MDELLNAIHRGDCVKRLAKLPEGGVDLVFADPPFNIGYEYDVYNDAQEREHYLKWSDAWMAAVHRVLKDDGAFWLAIGDEYAAELKIAAGKLGFHCRSWVIWYYTFGVNCTKKFTRSHAHLFYFVKNPAKFTFRDDDLENRIPSARELVYKDARANPRGRLPDDTWIIRPAGAVGEMTPDDDATWPAAELETDPPTAGEVHQDELQGPVEPPRDDDRTFTLRPQDSDECFTASEDTWYFPRVAGTFKERAGFHGCQMPEQLLGRIIRTCSHEGEIVLDPFSGSGTTLAVAKKLGRRYIGFDLSADYVKYGRQRLRGIRVGDPLDGSAEPTKSAPRTNRAAAKKTASAALDAMAGPLVEAFRKTHDGYSADRVVADPELNQRFIAECRDLKLPGGPAAWNALLFRARKAGRLADVPTSKRTTLTWEQCDPYLFASEIALRLMLDDQAAVSLDEILCDPNLGADFDRIAGRFAPGRSPLEYRWAALKLRKEAHNARTSAAKLKLNHRGMNELTPLAEIDAEGLAPGRGLYWFASAERPRELYVGQTLNLAKRLRVHQTNDAELCERFEVGRGSLLVQTLPLQSKPGAMLAWQSCYLIRKNGSRFNYAELWNPA